ncbi:hypothetical protein ABID08_005322 [Rhizobium binae]|uniref:Uncharacterized protein n=1 Tax=Rhizobium binae TaxID=1138190 RepID=A0ABV2MNA5_9HYPH
MPKLAFEHCCPRRRQQAQRTRQRAARSLRDEIYGIFGFVISVPFRLVPDVDLPSQPIAKNGGARPKHFIESMPIGLKHVSGEYPQHIWPSWCLDVSQREVDAKQSGYFPRLTGVSLCHSFSDEISDL